MRILKFLAFLALLGVLSSLSASVFENKKEVRYEADLKPQEEVLDDVKKTQEIFQMKAKGIKPPKPPRDPRNKIFIGVKIASVYSTAYNVGQMLGVEFGYNFVVQKNNSLRIYTFFDRYANTFDSYFNFDRTRANVYQMYRAGMSAEYRAYVNAHFGTKMRLIGLGVSDVASTSDNKFAPEYTTKRNSGILPLVAAGLIFVYKGSEIFLGLDFLDYQPKSGAVINFLEYGLRF